MPFSESKTPGQLEVVTVVNGSTITNGKSAITTPSPNVETSSFTERKPPADLNFACTNPVQKPPRLTEISYTTSHYNGSGSVISPGPCFVSPSSGSGNNPDLINDTKRLGSGELPTDEAASTADTERPGSGEYSRNGCDSLYPSGLWEQSASPDVYLRRTGSSTLPGFSYDDKTPIIGDGTSTEDETDFSSRSLPRPPHQHNGYPPDYGLPIVDHKPLQEAGAQMTLPTNAKTLRVWQRGGVPVLPPVTALKRALTSSRNSPDEGYQEGCGTDV